MLICNIEHDSFATVLFSSSSGMGKTATATYLSIWLSYIVRWWVPYMRTHSRLKKAGCGHMLVKLKQMLVLLVLR